MKMRCPFLGCDGIIDLDKEIAEFTGDMGLSQKSKIKNIPFAFHTIMCKKCHNPVGGFDLGPNVFCSFGGDAYIHTSSKDIKKGVILKGYKKMKKGRRKLLNPYLKEWARI
jgi:hypothetical protein